MPIYRGRLTKGVRGGWQGPAMETGDTVARQRRPSKGGARTIAMVTRGWGERGHRALARLLYRAAAALVGSRGC